MAGSLIPIQGVVLALLFVLFYGNLVPGFIRDWSANPNVTHSFLIPFVSAYVIWHRRAKLKTIPIVPAPQGCVALLLSLSLSLFGALVGDEFTVRLSMLMSLCSMIYLLFGKQITKALLFPILYLLTMVPLPYVAIKELMNGLRYFNATISEVLLKFSGFPVDRDGYFLHFPDMILEVADECSGITTLLAIFSLTLLYAYFLPVCRKAKFLLSLSAIPCAIIANLVRITITAALTYFFGLIVLESFLHSLAGAVNFVIGVVLVLSMGEYLAKKCAALAPQQGPTAQAIAPKTRPVEKSAATGAFIIAVSMFALAFWLSGKFSASAAPKAGIRLETLSSSLTPAYPVTINPLAEPYQDTKADRSLLQVYEGPGQAPIELFIAYRAIQHGVDRLQSPKLVFPDGWNSAWVKPAQIDTPGGDKISANWMLTRKTGAQRLVLYWYQDREGAVAGEFERRLKLIKKRIFGDFTDAAMVRIATPLSDGEPIEQAQARLRPFALALQAPLERLFRRED